MKLPPLAWGAAAGFAALLVLAPATGTALGRLASARAEHARLRAATDAPVEGGALVSAGQGLQAADAAGGRAAMMARVQRLAKAGGVLVEETNAAAAPAGLVALRLRVSGAEKAVVAFTDAFERETPMMRLRAWRLEPVAGGVRLSGEAVAAWR